MKKKNNDSFPQLNKNAGFSLVELLIAVIILAIIVVPLLHGFVTSARMNGKARQTQRAITVAQDLMEGLKAYDIEELKEQFNDPVNGFYVMESKLIKGSIGEDTDREQNDPVYRGDPDMPGVYYFTLEGVQIQGSEFDALIRIDARNYEQDPTKDIGIAYGHDNAFNDINMASPGSVMKGKDGSYTQSVTLNQVAAEDAQAHFGLEGDTDSLFTFKTFKDRGGIVKRTITLHLTASGVDENGNVCSDADITYTYDCTYGGETYSNHGNLMKGQTVDGIGCASDISSGNFYLFYYPLYEAAEDRIVIQNDSHQPFRIYIVKQLDSVTEARLSDSQLDMAERTYKAVVNIEDTTADNVKIRTNLGMNLVNASFLPPSTPVEGQLPTYEVEKADIPTQAQYYLNGAPNGNVNVFGLSGIRLTNIPGHTGTGNDDDITEVIFDIQISVYKKGAKDDDFPDSQRMAYITGSKNN
ncbi:MAG: prepilin-type N-terminal cleavage/methylation domain-containing protein [Lachnospiraceae bacterium]|nr:prepilin-type N-terminal cleavage/methylation domain-containing protein [Lachnospiraceae bacterium]